MPRPATELRFDDVTAGYGDVAVVEHLSFSVREGERVGFIGRNGAGKTTALATAMGLADSMSGRISLGGSDIGRASTYLRSRAGLGYVPQSPDIFASLSGAATVARSCRAANSRCCRSRGRSSASRASFCSTSRSKGWRRWSARS